MAKSKSRKGSGGRGASVHRHDLHPVVIRPLQRIGPRRVFSQYQDDLAAGMWNDQLTDEDRRRFRPDKSVAPPSKPRAAARLRQGRYPGTIHFAQPDRLALCIRRYVRARVMHATGFAGIRKFKFKKPRRNFWSRISC